MFLAENWSKSRSNYISEGVPHVCGGLQGSAASDQCWKLDGQTDQWSHAGRWAILIVAKLWPRNKHKWPEWHPAVADIQVGIMTEFLFQLEWHVLFIGTLLAILFQRSILITEIAISIDRKPISVAFLLPTSVTQPAVDGIPESYFRELSTISVNFPHFYSCGRDHRMRLVLWAGGKVKAFCCQNGQWRFNFFARCYQAFPFQDEWGLGCGISRTPPTTGTSGIRRMELLLSSWLLSPVIVWVMDRRTHDIQRIHSTSNRAFWSLRGCSGRRRWRVLLGGRVFIWLQPKVLHPQGKPVGWSCTNANRKIW